MAKNRYNTAKMKSTATSIENELKKYQAAKRRLDTTIRNLHMNWDDDANRQYVSKYDEKAKPIAENLEKKMKEYAYILNQCAKKYGAAIDNGNSRFTW